MASLGTLDFSVQLDDSKIQQQIKKLQGELNSLGNKSIDVNVEGKATDQLSAIKSSLESINKLKDITINISQLEALQNLKGTISNLTIDQGIIDSIVKRIEQALANSRVKLSAADTSEIRKSVEQALVDAVNASGSTIANGIAKHIKDGLGKVKLNIDSKSLADSVQKSLENRVMKVKGLTVDGNDLAASIKNAMSGKSFYVTVKVNESELIKSVNDALAKVNKLGVAAQQANNAGTNAVNKHTSAYRPLSEQMKTTTQLATILGNTMGNLFSVYAVKNFLESIVQIGGELEKQKLAMSAIIGDAHDAQIIFKQISDLSMISPFDVQDLVKYTKQLSAFGIQYDKLYDTTRRLSDLAAGVGVSFGRIAYEFGQTSARGWLDGRELRMFANSGIPLLQKLSELYTEIRGEVVSAAEVREMVTNRQVSFEDVEKVIKRMTDEGGEFYRMQEVMAESLAAKWRNLGNDWNLMMGQIAESSVGDSLKGLAETLMTIVENWKMVIAVAQPFAYSFMVFKSATAILNGFNSVVELGGKKIKETSQATYTWGRFTRGLGRTLMANAGIIATVVVGAIFSLISAYNEAKKEQEEYEASIKGIGGKIEREFTVAATDIDRFVAKLGLAKDNQKEYEKTIDSLKSKYGEYLGNISREASAYNEVAVAAEKAKEAIKEKIREQQLESTMQTINEKYSKKYKDNDKLIRNYFEGYTDNFGKDIAPEVVDSIIRDIESAIKQGVSGSELNYLISSLYENYTNALKNFFMKDGIGKYYSTGLQQYLEAYKDEQRDIQEAVVNSGGYNVYSKYTDPINEFYENLKSKETDHNKILQIEAERLSTLIKLFSGEGVSYGNEVLLFGPKSQTLADKYSAELDVLKNTLSKKWLEISNEVFGAQKKFSENAGGGEMSQIIFSDLGVKKDENDYLAYLRRLAEEYKKLQKSVEQRGSVGNKEAIGDKESEQKIEKETEMIARLEEYARRLGITWEDFDKKQKKAPKGTDEQLKQWKARVDAIKKFYEQYQKFYKEYSNIFDENTAKSKALEVVNKSGLFDPWRGIFDVPTNVVEYKNLLGDVYKEIKSATKQTDERRKLSETLMQMINLDVPYDILADDITKSIEKALAEAEKVLAENRERFDFFKQMLEATGDSKYSERWSTFLHDKIIGMMNDKNKNVDPIDLIGLSDSALMGLMNNGTEIKAIREYIKAYKDAFDTEAKEVNSAIVSSIKTIQTSLQSYNAMYENYLDMRAKFEKKDPSQLASFDASFQRNSVDALMKVFADNDGIINRLLSGKTGNWQISINEAKDELKKLIAIIRGENVDSPLRKLFSDEQLQAMRGNEELVAKLIAESVSLESVWDKLGANGVGGLVGAIGGIFDKLSKNKAINAQLAKLKNGTKEFADLESKLISNEEIAGSALTQGFTSAFDILQKISSTMKEIADATNNDGLANLADFYSGLANVFGSAAQGASTGSWIGALVGGATAMLEELMSGIASSTAYLYDSKQSIVDFRNELMLLRLTINENDYDSVFGTNSFLKVQDAANVAKQAIDEYYDYINKADKNAEWESKGQFALATDAERMSHVDKLSASLSAYAKGYNDLQSIVIKTKDYNWLQERFGKKDEYKLLKDYAPELWGSDGMLNVENAKAFLQTEKHINEEQKKQIQHAIDLKEAYDDAMSVIDEQIESWFGDWSKSMSDTIFDAVINGTYAWDEFEKSGTEALLNIGKTIGMSKIFESYFSGFQKDLEGAIVKDDGGKAIMDSVSKIFAGLPGVMDAGLKFAEGWTDAMVKYGYDPTMLSGNSLSSSIKGITEQTADVLASYLNAIRADVSCDRVAIESIYGQQLPQLQLTADAQLIQLNQQTEYLRLIRESNDGIFERVDSIDSKFGHIVAGTKRVYTA